MQIKEKEILLTGLSNNPNDLTCEDGNLAIALNVVHEEGSLKNACHSAPKVVKASDTYYAIYKHVIEEELKTNIFLRSGDNICYCTIDSAGNVSANSPTLFVADITSVCNVGNIMIFYSNTSGEEVNYYLWKNGSYIWLGNDLPEIEMTFGLTHHIYDYMKETTGGAEAYKDGFRIFVPDTDVQDSGISGSSHVVNEKDVDNVTDSVFGLVNRFQGDWCAKNGYFSQPFFVRYALRLYDGTHTKHSAPILMIPATGTNPTIPIIRARHEPGSNNQYIDINCVGIGSTLNYYIQNRDALGGNWKDIIKGVDIFVSAPIYTYDSTEKVKRFTMPHWGDGSFYSPWIMSTLEDYVSNERTFGATSGLIDEKKSVWDIYTALKASGTDPVMSLKNVEYVFDHNTEDGAKLTVVKSGGNVTIGYIYNHMYELVQNNKFYPISFMHVPQKTVGEFDKEVRDCANFYLAKSIPTDELANNGIRTEVKIDKSVLNSIVSQERLDDDWESHHIIQAKYSKVYNSRLNMADISKEYFKGFSPYSMFQRVANGGSKTATIKIFIKTDNAETYVVNKATDYFSDYFNFPYIYYPDPKAYKAEVYFNGNVYSYPMKEHRGLNGALAYIGIETIKSGEGGTTFSGNVPTTYTAYKKRLANYVYTTELDNPFKVKAKNVERIGGGEVIALMPQAVAMSQGQFGQFPMIAFTTDGVWSLSVSDTGGWVAKQPFSRDVLLSAKAVLQLDREIIFATKRGLMQISGSSVECISDVFNGDNDLFTNAYKQYAVNAMSTYCSTNLSAVTTVPTFKEYVNNDNVSMHYDYSHQRIIIGNSNYPYSFVFNIQDKLWTCETLCLHSAVNSYPDALANLKSGSDYILVDLTKEGAASSVGIGTIGFVMTRPIKLDGIGLKTITSVIANGTFHRNHVYLLLYASNDMRTWVVHSTSKTGRLENIFSTPFRFYRIGVVTKLEKGEQIVSLTVGFESRELLSDNN